MTRLAELGREGLLLLCGDSTNGDRPGFAPSEKVAGPNLLDVFSRCKGRIVVTSFASNIHRVQQCVDAAAALDRKVCLVGRSMRKNTNIGRSLGHIKVPEGIIIGPRELAQFPDHKVVVISTGSQGEPLSALRRMAHKDHPQVELHAGDTVVFSATPIPGNERAVNDTIDRLYHIGCDVITTKRRADPRLRPRLSGGDQAHAQPDAAEVRHAVSRRLQAHPPARASSPSRSASSRRTSSRARTACRSSSTPRARAGARRCSRG